MLDLPSLRCKAGGSDCVYRCLKEVYISSRVNHECQVERFSEMELTVPDYPFDDEPKSLNTDASEADAA